MRVVALEEHISVPALAKTIDPAAIAARGHYKGRKVAPGKVSPIELLAEKRAKGPAPKRPRATAAKKAPAKKKVAAKK